MERQESLITLSNFFGLTSSRWIWGLESRFNYIQSPMLSIILYELLIGTRFTYRYGLIKSPEMLIFLFVKSVGAQFILQEMSLNCSKSSNY